MSALFVAAVLSNCQPDDCERMPQKPFLSAFTTPDSHAGNEVHFPGRLEEQ